MMKFNVFINIALLICGFCLNTAFGQKNDSAKMVRYSSEYTFKDGIYLEYSQFRNNSPLDFSATNLPSPKQTRPDKAMDETVEISYFDEFGIKKVVAVNNIWGYCYQDKIYVQHSGGFHMLPYIGSISHFVAEIQVRYSNRADPFYDPYYVYSGPSSYITTETRQMILDTETGKIFEFTPENILRLIQDEPELHAEYAELRKRKQRKMMFYYIRMYNEKNELYFPAD